MKQEPLDAAIEEILRMPRADQVDALLELRTKFGPHPDQVARIDEELSLLALLNRLPTPPISSNFTTRVLGEIQSESMPHPRHRAAPSPQISQIWTRFRRLLPIAALASLAIGVSSITLFSRLNQTATLSKNAVDLARTARLADSAETPVIEVLADFDAIQMTSDLPSPAQVDEDVALLAALSQ